MSGKSMTSRAAPIPRATWERIQRRYFHRWKIRLCLARTDGSLIAGSPPCPKAQTDECRALRELAISEAVRWGEPTVEICPHRRLVWAVPLMHNSRVTGGLIASLPEARVIVPDSGRSRLDVRMACADLRQLAEEENLTNAALLLSNRDRSTHEQGRAQAIHDYKSAGGWSFQDVYQREEPALLAALRKGDQQDARQRLNRILVAILHRSSGRMEVTKSYFMELVVTLFRTAVSMGADPESVLGANYDSMAQLSRIRSEEDLAPWIAARLDRLINCIHRQSRESIALQMHAAQTFMRDHFAEPLTRNAVARVAGMSPTHFSRSFHRHFRRTFVDLLNQLRVDKACELLATSRKDLLAIALDCGFGDQSYFTKVFRRYTGLTPRAFLLRHTRPHP
jgi:AraC-like DNA-binding protein